MDELTLIARGVHHSLPLAESSARDGRPFGRDRIPVQIRPCDLPQQPARDDPDLPDEPEEDVERF